VARRGAQSTFGDRKYGELSIALMAQMPLPLIPAFLVPLFVMPHLTGPQSRRLTDALNN
jgi:hypothetical protein